MMRRDSRNRLSVLDQLLGGLDRRGSAMPMGLPFDLIEMLSGGLPPGVSVGLLGPNGVMARGQHSILEIAKLAGAYIPDIKITDQGVKTVVIGTETKVIEAAELHPTVGGILGSYVDIADGLTASEKRLRELRGQIDRDGMAYANQLAELVDELRQTPGLGIRHQGAAKLRLLVQDEKCYVCVDDDTASPETTNVEVTHRGAELLGQQNAVDAAKQALDALNDEAEEIIERLGDNRLPFVNLKARLTELLERHHPNLTAEYSIIKGEKRDDHAVLVCEKPKIDEVDGLTTPLVELLMLCINHFGLEVERLPKQILEALGDIKGETSNRQRDFFDPGFSGASGDSPASPEPANQEEVATATGAEQ